MIIKTLYIIGNGFDLAHGLKTNYWLLRTFIEEKNPYFIRTFESKYDIEPLDDTEPWYTEEVQIRWNDSVNHSLWSEFEKCMGEPNTTEMLDMSESVTEGMPSDGIRYHMDCYWREEFEYIDRFHDYVREWIESVDTSKVICLKKSLLNSEDYFFNFNYTDILEKVYGIENVLHIHGGVQSVCDIPPIMGHCNKKSIEKHRVWAKEADEEFAEAEASIQNAVADYLEKIYKDTDERISENASFFRKLKEVNHVVVIGWSAGEVDIPYLKKIKNSVNCKTKWTVYWYDENAYGSLNKAFTNEGITDRNIIEYLKSELFWD